MSFSNSSTIENLAKVIRGDMALNGLAHLLAKDQAIDMDKLLNYHGVTALSLYENTKKAINTDQEKDKLPLMVANESIKSTELKRILSGLNDRGLTRFLLFKGTALAYSIYEKPWLRPRTDTDILINESELNKFVDAFTQLGYCREFAIDGDLISYQCTFSKHLAGNAHMHIDVHWRISNRQCLATVFNTEELLQRALPINKLSNYAQTPNNIDCLVLACQHRLGHHHTEERLIWLYDIHLLANSLNKQDWGEFLKIVEQKRLSNICLDGLQSAQRYIGTDIVPEVIKQLETLAQNDEPSAIFLNRSLSNWQILINDLRSISSVSNKFRFVFQILVPKPSYIRLKMKTRYASWGYIKRALQGLKKL